MSVTGDVLAKYPNDYFVETGTFQGNAVALAIEAGFSDIRSVEVNLDLYMKCCERFKDDERVRLWYGDSLEELPEMISDIDDPITFWLDAHIGNVPFHGSIRIPLLNELALIAKHPVKGHTILIDDVRLMGQGAWLMVTQEKVVSMLKAMNPKYHIRFEDSAGYKKDIMVAVLNGAS